jgi:hypothetical protein
MNDKYTSYYQEYNIYKNLGIDVEAMLKERLFEDFRKEINEHMFTEPEKKKNTKRYILIGR